MAHTLRGAWCASSSRCSLSQRRCHPYVVSEERVPTDTSRAQEVALTFLPWFQRWISPAVSTAIPALIAWAVSWFTDFGARAHLGVMIALGALLPILFVAAAVEFGLVTARAVASRRARKDAGNWVVGVGRLYFAWFIAGETCCLWAIGQGRASTFLVLVPLVMGVRFANEVAIANRYKFGIERMPFYKQREMYLRGVALGYGKRALRRRSDDADAPGVPAATEPPPT